jgi:hypothetical protein
MYSTHSWNTIGYSRHCVTVTIHYRRRSLPFITSQVINIRRLFILHVRHFHSTLMPSDLPSWGFELLQNANYWFVILIIFIAELSNDVLSIASLRLLLHSSRFVACSTRRFTFLNCTTRSSATARLPKLWVRIPLRVWIFVVTVVCCRVGISSTSWSLIRRSPTDCDVSFRVL